MLLAFSITEPSLILNRDVVSGDIVFILDVSASSQVVESDGNTRLNIAKEKIEELATSRNSLILLKSSPVIALQDARRSDLVRYLDRTQATDSSSDIAAAIMLAGDMLANKKGRVIVASDFIESKGVDADVAKNVLESRGIGVDFLDTKQSKRENVGIVDMIISGEDVNLYIKNFNEEKNKISLKINDEINDLEIAGGAVEPFVFTIESNLTTAEILEKDDFLVDNKVFITRPYPEKIKVLWITSNPSKFLEAIFNSIEDVTFTIAEPPIIPDGNYDIYIISGVDKDKIVFDNFGSIFRNVRDEGKSAIVVAQRDVNNLDFEGLLPLEFGNFTEGGLATVDQVNKFTKDIEFGIVDYLFETKQTGSSIVSVGNNSIITLFDAGKGKVLYYGIMESESDFEITPGYPIFWNNLIYSFVGRDNLNDVNIKTGFTLEIRNETKNLDKVGIYQLGDVSIAANLINEKESDINFIDTESVSRYVEGELESIKSDVDYRMDLYLVAIVLLILALEFIYIKYRGEVW